MKGVLSFLTIEIISTKIKEITELLRGFLSNFENSVLCRNSKNVRDILCLVLVESWTLGGFLLDILTYGVTCIHLAVSDWIYSDVGILGVLF